MELIKQNTDRPSLGILGDPGVNVLMLNIALDKIAPMPAPAPTTTSGKRLPPRPPSRQIAAKEAPMGYEVEIGQVLDQRFKITGQLSQGGMATVFRALDLSHSRRMWRSKSRSCG